jgi:hypothetical protein
MESRKYPTDLSDDEWCCISPHLPEPAGWGRPRLHGFTGDPRRRLLCAQERPLLEVCSASFLEEFFSETGLPALQSRDLLLGKGRSLLSSMLPTLVVCHPPADTPPLMPYRRFANASPGPAELATPSPRTLRIWPRVAVRRPGTTRRLGYGPDSQQPPRSWLAHYGIAQYRRLSTLYKLSHGPADVSRGNRCTSSKHLGSRRCAYYASQSRGECCCLCSARCREG